MAQGGCHRQFLLQSVWCILLLFGSSPAGDVGRHADKRYNDFPYLVSPTCSAMPSSKPNPFTRSHPMSAEQVQITYQQALACHRRGQGDAAKTLYETVLQAQPGHIDALYHLGLLALQTGNFLPAAALFGQAIKLQPNLAQAYCNRGSALKALKRSEEAVASFQQALALQPDFAEAYSNLADLFIELGQFDAAITHCDRAIALRPNYADAHYNRGVALQKVQRIDEAVASYRQAVALQADDDDAGWNLSLALLLSGDFQEGWEMYERRWKARQFTSSRRDFSQPLWLGQAPLSGKTILLHSEQGLGDTIQFCRYAKLVAGWGARVILEVPPSLAELLKTLDGVAEIRVKGERLPAFDFHCPLLSLPLAFKTTLNTIPRAQQYLAADEEKRAYWNGRLGERRKPRVGLAWSGRPTHTNDHNRSLPLAALMQHLPAGYHYVSLQKEVRETDRPVLDAHPDILYVGGELNDFSDTAALIQCMDLVVCVDTSVAHLSAALGKQTWIMLPFVPDWRWMLDRDDSPWYPSVRLYRQTQLGDWQAMLCRLNESLCQTVAR
ncbi:MAG: glycosyltransferase family protein [Paludibacterium sp.]|nr:glycosyltransferase family protein [Paludibacterium sp.]